MGEKKEESYSEIMFSDLSASDGELMSIPADGDEIPFQDFQAPEVLPILPLRNTVLFPGVVIPISVGRQKSLKLIHDVAHGDKLLGALTQIEGSIDDPDQEDLFRTGTIAQVLKVLEMPDGSTSVIIQGKRRFSIDRFVDGFPYIKANVRLLDEIVTGTETAEFTAIVGSLKDLSVKIAQYAFNAANEAAFAVKNIENPSFLINFICSNADIKIEEKQALLEITDLKERGVQAVSCLVREVQMLELKREIQLKVKSELDQQQKEFFLNQQIKTIQNELGGSPTEQEINELKEAAVSKRWNEETASHFNKEVTKLSRLNPAAGEYSVQYSYCQTLLDLPWDECTKDNFDLRHAGKVLNEDHYGLEQVKERILEHLAVLKLKNDMKAPILCLYGPPGVGKTSLGKSVARALGRKYVRMSLGGLHDESEIRGHRKTYIGAMPGRIIQNIKKVKASNPVFVLDEIDKVSRDFHGDPASALLEVLDPEQNFAFHDNYLEVDYDLSKVLFIATANTLSTIASPLLDRLELIEVSGYIPDEKIEIARRHLVPKQLENHGLKPDQLSMGKDVIEHIVEYYTRESGVRGLDKSIAKIVRRVTKKVASGDRYNKEILLSDVREYLGVEKFSKEVYQGNDFYGVVTGLAWTAHGGEILFVEASQSSGKGTLTLTGNLGEVMKESAMLALEYLKSHATELGVDPSLFETHNWHIHVPEGAIPKDGPSAGVTMVTALASVITKRKVKKSVAMTGEITLRGKVLPVGGIKEKILAAKRAGIKDVLMSEDNRKDLEEIKKMYLKGLRFSFVKTIGDLLECALEKKVRKV